MPAVNRGITHSYREKSRELGKILRESGSTKEGKRGRISPMHLAAEESSKGCNDPPGINTRPGNCPKSMEPCQEGTATKLPAFLCFAGTAYLSGIAP